MRSTLSRFLCGCLLLQLALLARAGDEQPPPKQAEHQHRREHQEHPDHQHHPGQAQNPDEEVKGELASQLSDSDSDEDGDLDAGELARWVRRAHAKQLQRSVDHQWRHYEPTKREEHTWQDYDVTQREYLAWPQYRRMVLRDLQEDQPKDDPAAAKAADAEHEKLLARYERRWTVTDEDGDGQLSKQEFRFFMHPEESTNETVRALLVEELKQDLDQDHDGRISYEEYIEHVKHLGSEQERADPRYVQEHRVHYETYLDMDKDGVLNDSELRDWISPDYDKHQLEAERLLELADANHDSKLQTEEMLAQFEHFYSLLTPEFWDKFIPEQEEPLQHAPVHDEF